MTKDRARIKVAKYLEWADLADRKRRRLANKFYEDYKDFDWTEPVKIGHHSQRRHEREFEKRDSFFKTQIELDEKIKLFRDKAENLMYFANRDKGDAEKARELQRRDNDLLISIGSRISDVVYGAGEVIKVNKKTYTVDWDSGSTFPRDKSFVKLL